ncbi:hypothetical protein [Pseudenhygromyxa sp. WMMC2535]|uniref:hypothetical protein n=1 Tax=Pseudenhygromyxa sp. WMMC2535 TaxID=2712867 RepID=UPI0015536084|nr:hypothetical protein [Pseudenhygromyxa sp. WMMC2535]
MVDHSLPSSHGGLVFPLDTFRPTMLAAVLAEGLVAQARNILDAKLVLTRHPEVPQLVLGQIIGSVLDGNPAAFWRENPELGLIASQIMRHQLFQYWVEGGEEPRQGFIVAQRGQALAAQDATRDQMPPGSMAQDWPVAQLTQQLQITIEELAGGFEGGPQIELSLVDREGDDRELLMTLVGQMPGAEDEDPAHGQHAQQGQQAQQAQPAGAPGPASDDAQAPAQPKRITAEEDRKRRAAEHQAELEARQAKADSIRADLPYISDALGVVVAPKSAELADTDILEPFLIPKVEGDIPSGLPRELHQSLQGKRVDFAVPVEFLSEVFTSEGPLNKPAFDEGAQVREIGGQSVKVLEVLAPRLGSGSFIRRERAGVFVSRTPDLPLPEALIVALLDQQG